MVAKWYVGTTGPTGFFVPSFLFLADLDTMRAMTRQSFRAVFLSFLFLTVLVASGLALGAGAQDKHPFGLDDYSALRRARALAVSPDGKTVLYVASYDGDKGPTKREWHLIDATGENARKLEFPESFEPAGFTRDGKGLYGAYEVDHKGQLGIIPLGGGKPTQIISLPNGIHGHWISPDGNKFAFTADPRPNDPLADIRHVAENDVTSIYVASASGSEGTWWCPDLRDVGELAWSADSSQLAVVTQLQKIGHHDVRATIWVCSSGGVRKVADIPNSVSGIAWANGGKDLAFASTTTDVLTPDHLWIGSASGGTPQDQTPNLDGTIWAVLAILAARVGGNAQGHHRRGVFLSRREIVPRLSLARGHVLLSAPAISPFALPSDVVAFTVSDPTHSANVAVAHGTELQKITHEGDDTLAKVALGEVRVVNWTAKDGTKLEGILTLPANYEGGKHYPVPRLAAWRAGSQ